MRSSLWRAIAPCALTILLSTLASLAAATPSRAAAVSCTTSPYAYSGLFGTLPATGIRTVITPLATPEVATGHVAAWIGVGGPNAAPDGSAEWLQAGVFTEAGAWSTVYVETALPDTPVQELTLTQNVVAGASYSLAVEQVPGEPEFWQVWFDGTAVTQPVFLPGSDAFAPMAMSESLNAASGTCNSFAYRFTDLQVTDAPRHWLPMAETQPGALWDPGYELLDRGADTFVAQSG